MTCQICQLLFTIKHKTADTVTLNVISVRALKCFKLRQSLNLTLYQYSDRKFLNQYTKVYFISFSVNTDLYVKSLLILTTHWPLPLHGCARPPAHSAQSIPYVPFGQHTATNSIFCSKYVPQR